MADIDGGLIGGASLQGRGIFGDRAGLTARRRSETMNMLETVLLILHLLVAVAICGFVLLQHGKGADMGAAFGSGSSGSLFGAAGSANFLSRTTAILAAVFFVSSLGLTWFATSTRRTVGRRCSRASWRRWRRRPPTCPPAPGAASRRRRPAPRTGRRRGQGAGTPPAPRRLEVGRGAEVTAGPTKADVVKLVDTLS